MRKIVISPTLFSEKNIADYKEFYKGYLLGVKRKDAFLKEADSILKRFEEKNVPHHLMVDQVAENIIRDANSILETYIGKDVVDQFNQEIAFKRSKKFAENIGDEHWLKSLVTGFAEVLENAKASVEARWKFRKQYLAFVKACVQYDGLHPDIEKRDPLKFKRFNVWATHYYRSRKPLVVMKCLLSFEEFNAQFLKLYNKRKPIKFGGIIIPFDKLHEIKITTTFLLNDEIELFAHKHKFTWYEENKDKEQFILHCKDETEEYHSNPFEEETTEQSKPAQVQETRVLLTAYPKALKLFNQGIDKYDEGIYLRNSLDDLRLSLELLLKQLLKNRKSLENQLADLGRYKKEKGFSPELLNMFDRLLNYYSAYQNNNVKHDDNVNLAEVELTISLTCTFIVFILK
jgi:hypothetical protein